nr:biogenesis of lysosome-related organelles complex 1 subunit kxd1 [Quercus suber]
MAQVTWIHRRYLPQSYRLPGPQNDMDLPLRKTILVHGDCFAFARIVIMKCGSAYRTEVAALSSIFLTHVLPLFRYLHISPLHVVMSASYMQYQYQPNGSLPVNVAGKTAVQGYAGRSYTRDLPMYGQMSSSPPERPESVSTSGAGLYSSASSQYGGSEYDTSSTGATSVDLLDYMNDRLSQTYDRMPLDRQLAKQAQLSGELNAKNRELQDLQAQARARLARTRANFSEGMKAAKDVQRDLEWTQNKMIALNKRAAVRYPEQYRVARERYPAPVDH